MDGLRLDFTHGLRSLGKQPGYVAVAVLSLALGIGVNTAIFSALNSLLLRPLPLRDLDRTVIVYHSRPANADMGTSFPAFERYRDRTETFDGAMAFAGARPMMLDVDERGNGREQVYAELVTSGFFSIASVNLQHGAPFTADVDRPSTPQFVVVLSDRYWRKRFASDSGVVGRPIILNSKVFTVTGVAAPGFAGLDAEASADLWIPMTTWAHVMSEPGRLSGDEHWITTVARLRAGVTIEQAGTAVSLADQADPAVDGRTTRVRSARERVMGSALDTLAIAGGAFAVGLLVLMLACTNVANLLMARAAARQGEMSVRLALGGSRSRLVRLYLVESLLLSISAGTLGLLFASWLIDLAVAFKPPTLIGESAAPTLPLTFALDTRLFTFAVGLSVLTAGVVGLLAGLQGTRPGVLLATKSGRGADRRFAPGFNVRSAVIALQIALSLILLIPCGLFIRSGLNASVISPGFATSHVLLLPISANQAGMRIQKPEGFDWDLPSRIATLPGVEAASVMDPVPLWFGGRFASFAAGGSGAGGGVRIGHASITPGYFATLKIPLLAGRDFTRSDTASAPAVAIINETLARRFWPGDGAVGQRLRDGTTSIEVVGVAKDAKYVTLADSSPPFVYLPQTQSPGDNLALSLAVRTTGDPMALAPAIEREVRALVPGWPVFQFRTLDEGLALQQQAPRLAATLLGVLGGFGLLLAAVGVYGVMAYVVRQRTHEIGIRLALGAPIANVLALVIKQGMAVCLVGAGAGVALSLAASQLLASLLFGISAMDPITYAIVPAVLIGVALLACYLPARRITKLQALQALREE